MKALRNILFFALVIVAAVACNGQKIAPAVPTDPVDRTKNHNASQCPNWNGPYLDAATVQKWLYMFNDSRGRLNFDEGDKTTWIVDGKPYFMKGRKTASYTAYCTNLTPSAGGDAAHGILVEAYEYGKPIFVVHYVDVTSVSGTNAGKSAYEISILNTDGSAQKPADTYTHL